MAGQRQWSKVKKTGHSAKDEVTRQSQWSKATKKGETKNVDGVTDEGWVKGRGHKAKEAHREMMGTTVKKTGHMEIEVVTIKDGVTDVGSKVKKRSQSKR